MEEKITVLLVEPGKDPKLTEVANRLPDMQELVGGHIEAYGLDEDEKNLMVCNEEGKIMGLPVNFLLRSEGKCIDYVAGTAFICSTDGEGNFTSFRGSPEELGRCIRRGIRGEVMLRW